MAEAALKNEQMGKTEGGCDMLCISVSSTDAISHRTGTWFSPGKENEEVYMTLDRDLTAFLNTLDAEVGKGNYLLFLSADHGGTHNPNTAKAHRLPGGGWDSAATLKNVNSALCAQFGVEGKFIKDAIGASLYLDHELINQNKLCYEKVKAAAIKELRKDHTLQWVVDYEKAAYAPIPEWVRERIINGYYYGRSGDIMAITHPGFFDWKVGPNDFGAQHGAWTPADTHIPLVFMGWHVKHGYTNRKTFMTDAAPTVCSMLHVEMPTACLGNPIVEITDQK